MEGLADGLASRALRLDDAAGVTELMGECEALDLGEAMIELDDIVSDWQRPSFDVAADTVGVFDGTRLLAYGEVYKGRRAEVYVRPEARGRGIGTALLRWTWRRARDAGGTLVGQTVPDSLVGAVDLFAAHGYRPLWTSWVLELPAGASVPVTELPAGYAIRTYREGDGPAVYRTVEDAFSEWPDRDPTAYEDWVAMVLGRPGFEPWQLLVATDGGGGIVGACYLTATGDLGWVHQIAVRADRRGLGLGRALLAAAFAAARDRGASRSELNTDSRTGALDLYLRVGMRVRQTFTHHARDL